MQKQNKYADAILKDTEKYVSAKQDEISGMLKILHKDFKQVKSESIGTCSHESDGHKYKFGEDAELNNDGLRYNRCRLCDEYYLTNEHGTIIRE